MRKFLALVLAMLMVSASAISVSAAFADQSAVDAHDYAEAIEELYDLGVIAGKEDASGKVAFDAEGTLTREEAAVVAAKLIAGSKQTFDWSAATTCRFTDVTAKWSFGYIEFAADRGVLDGVGGGKFNPKGTLSVAEAVALVVKASGLRHLVAQLDFIQKPTTWYLNWIEVAEDNDLLKDINPFSYTQSCSRAMMAQLASNALAANGGNNKLAAGFANQKTTVVGNIEKVTADGVVIGTSTFNTAAFNAALEGVTADQLIDCKVEVKYNPVTNKITDIDVLTSTLALDYKNGKIAVVKKNNNNTNTITLDGATYVVAATAGSNTGATGGIGGGTSTTNTITVTVDGVSLLNGATCDNLPTYYAGIAYDDNNDGIYDRVAIDSYRLATVKKESWSGMVNKNSSLYTPIYVVKWLDGTVAFKTYSQSSGKTYAHYEVTVAGDAALDGTTPVLVDYKTMAEGTADKAAPATISVIGKATKVSGVLEGYSSSGKYVTIGGTQYGWAADATVANPANWTLNNTVNAWTIDGKFINVIADFYTKSQVIVDSVSVVDGKAVVKGFDVANGYADITVTLTGIAGDRFVAKNAYYNWTAEDWAKAESDRKAYTAVVFGTLAANGKSLTKIDLTFSQGDWLQLVTVDSGIYVDGTKDSTGTNLILSDKTYAISLTKGKWIESRSQFNYWSSKTFAAQLNVNAAKNGNVWINVPGDATTGDHWDHTKTHTQVNCQPVPFYFLTNDFVVIDRVANTKQDANNPYDDYKFVKSAGFDWEDYCATAILFNKSVNTGTDTKMPGPWADTSANAYADMKSKAGEPWCTASMIYLGAFPKPTIAAKPAEITKIADNTGIVQIIESFETTYNTTKYHAIDLFTGTKIDVVSDNAALEAKAFYEYDTTTKTVTEKTLWVGNFQVVNEVKLNGVNTTTTLAAMPVKLVEQTPGNEDYVATQAAYDATKDVEFKNVIVYKTVEGLISFKDGKVETLKTSDINNGTNLCYIMGDTLIVIK